MGRILDFFLTEDWEQFQRVGLYKKLGKKLDNLSPKQLEKIKEVMGEDE